MPVDFKSYASMSAEEREADKEKMRLKQEQHKVVEAAKSLKYEELLIDATVSPRTSPWARDFVKSLLFRFQRGEILSWDDLSERQTRVLKRIEKEVYQVGGT